MKNRFVIINVDSLEDVITVQRKLSASRLRYYRGHEQAGWELESTLERTSASNRTVINQAETLISENFKKVAHNYIANPPLEAQVIDWLALMQHYGAPTRMLDVTRSFLVALFFATENATTDKGSYSAIWAFNDSIENIDALIAQPKPPVPSSAVPQGIDLTKKDHFHELWRLPLAQSHVFIGEPCRPDVRMNAQQGAFLVPVNESSPLKEQIKISYALGVDYYELDEAHGTPAELDNEDTFANDVKIAMIKIPSSLHIEILSYLDGCNVNAHVLFPGLDGLGRSLKLHAKRQKFNLEKTADYLETAMEWKNGISKIPSD